MPRRPAGSRDESIWTRPVPASGRSAPAFSREEITRAAIDLADGSGLGAVSFRRIAERIGSAPTSIYWYVSDKSELYELMVDAVLAEIDLPEHLAGEWRADLATIAWASLTTYRQHRWYSQLGIHPVPGPGTLRYAEIVLESLTSCGLDEPTAIKVLATMNNYILGFILRERAWQDLTAREQAPARWVEAATAGGPGRPADGPARDRDLSARLTLAGDEGFAFGLDCFLDGIAALLSRRG
ncbi:MAG TPA: TetR/AcrR family transcriptional regulator [Streptosporangiaceae bacterium]